MGVRRPPAINTSESMSCPLIRWAFTIHGVSRHEVAALPPPPSSRFAAPQAAFSAQFRFQYNPLSFYSRACTSK